MSDRHILIVEDDPDGLQSVTDALADSGFAVTAATNASEGIEAFQKGTFELVLSDLVLPDRDGIAVLNAVREVDRDLPVIIMTAYGSISTAVDAMKAGAYDYINKPLDLDDLLHKVSRASETHRLRREVTVLREVVTAQAPQIVAESPAMKEVMRQIEALKDTTATVLITGESGTGKEVIARALHSQGTRTAQPFVAVNCGAFAESLLDSELFGHERGAFTGATQQRKGAFERADGGTLFLDEIGDAPASVQIKLLRILEEREFYRVGGQAPIKVDVRLLSASNRDLDERVLAGEFREDLLYRLKVVSIELPPLRQRREDIRPLADRFMAVACHDHNREIDGADDSFYRALETHDWPGNVRELRNVVESAVILATTPALTSSNLSLGGSKQAANEGAFEVPTGMTFADLEHEILLQTLRRCDGNRTLAAEKLGLSRRTIQRKIQDLGLPF